MVSKLRSTRMAHAALVLPVALLAGGVVAPAAAATSPTPSHLVAKPDNVMVNTKIRLAGTGFPARTKLTVEECGTTSWVVPANPCDTNNSVSVRTDAHGRFASPLEAELCPRGKHPKGPATREACYVGVPHPKGVDTVRLVGAARVTVTYP